MSAQVIRPRRSFIFSPGLKPEMYPKALACGADIVCVELEDGMEKAARQARDLGFSGKGAIHPKQIAAINAVFTPNADQIARARRIIRTFEEADTGLVVIDGKLIEKPVLRDMHRILAIADRVSA